MDMWVVALCPWSWRYANAMDLPAKKQQQSVMYDWQAQESARGHHSALD